MMDLLRSSERLVRDLRGHPVINQAIAEADAQLARERQGDLEAIAALEAKRGRELPPLRDAEAGAKRAVEVARTALRKAEEELHARAAAASLRALHYDTAIARHE